MADSVSPAAVVKAPEGEIAAAEEYEEQDRLSQLPDEVLISILDKVEVLRDAVRTTVLSKRWRHLISSLSTIILDVSDFEPEDDISDSSVYTLEELAQSNISLVQATKSILAQNSTFTIELLSITFYLRDESIDIVRCVDKTMENREVLTAKFEIMPEKLDIYCTDDDMLTYGKRFMAFFDAYPRAFAGLTDLTLHSLRLGKSDIPSVLDTCKKLEKLSLENCDAGIRSILQFEHSHLFELSIDCCGFGSVELKWLPRLTVLTCSYWLPSQDQYPLSFGYVPQLWMLLLNNAGTTLHKTFELSEFLGNAVITRLDLNFLCERIWIQPEDPKRLAPLFKNLQVVTLRSIHEEYADLTWTSFFLEAAPCLTELNTQVSYHTCYSDEEDDYNKNDDMPREIYQKASNLLKWDIHADFKHYNMRKLTIEGFQVAEKFTRFIRRITEVAVNLEVVSLLESQPCGRCEFLPSTAYPRTSKETEMIKQQILDWGVSPIKIELGA
ncbi:hypothetical protein ACP4OV_031342 [Aristida adscensionis]